MNKAFIITFLILPSILLSKCTFTAEEMRLMTVEEWSHAGHNATEVEKALEAYHSTSAFTLSLDDFFTQPEAYFEKRVRALLLLLEAIDRADSFPSLEKLKAQAEKKRSYLEEVPKGTDSSYIQSSLRNRTDSRKDLSVVNHYWFELSDPLHRAGLEISLRQDKWNATDIPSFFIFLETIEYDPGLCRFAPYENHIAYYDEEEKQAHRLCFIEGKAYLHGTLFDTKQLQSQQEGAKVVSYVLGTDEEFYVSGHLRGKWHHSSLFAGGPVLDAGEIYATDGRITALTNKSGHYQPTRSTLLRTLETLEKKMGDLKGVKLKLWQFKSNGEITLHHVVYDAKEFLTCKGAAIAIDANMSWTPLHAAVWNDDIEIIPFAATPDSLNAKDDQGNTPLHLAVDQGHYKSVQLLLEMGAAINEQNKANGCTPLFYAVRNKNGELFELLLEYGADLRIINHKGETPLLLAAKFCPLNLFERILASYKDLQIEINEWPILAYAAQNDNSEVFLYCLERFGRDAIQTTDYAGNSLLHFAALSGSSFIFELLLDEGAPLEKRNNNGDTTLHFACAGGNDSVLKLILDKTPASNVNEKNLLGETPLIVGAGRLSQSSLQKLLDCGADILEQDREGRTVLHHLVSDKKRRPRKNMVFLIEKAFDDISQLGQLFDNCGYTPLHLAIKNEDLKAVYWYLGATNLGNITDGEGKDLVQYAEEAENASLRKYLLDKFQTR